MKRPKIKKDQDFYDIRKFQPKVPKQFKENYWRVHSIRDSLAELNKVLYNLKTSTEINIKLEEDIPEEMNPLDFALQKGDALSEAFVFIHLLDRLLNDFCHYTYFGLLSINPAHIAPSYSLLRKPFNQTIPLVELALNDFDDFMKKFINNIPELDKVVNSSPKAIERRKETRDKVSKSLGFPFQELIQDFIEVNLFDSSIHLVTTRKGNQTKNLNMNFIFLNEDAELAEEHTSYLIYLCAIYLSYAYTLFLVILKSIDLSKLTKNSSILSEISSIDENYEMLHSYALMLMVLDNEKRPDGNTIKLFNIYTERLEIKCKNCTEILSITSLEDLQVFADYEVLGCHKCNSLLIRNKLQDIV